MSPEAKNAGEALRRALDSAPRLRRVEPSRHLYAGHVYVNADKTDIRKTFARELLRLERSA